MNPKERENGGFEECCKRNPSSAEEKTRKKKKWIFRGLALLFLGLFLFSAFQVVRIYFGYHSNAKLQKELNSMFFAKEGYKGDAAVQPVPETEVTGNGYNFDVLSEINGDVFGWIRIADTKVSYPVLQGESNDTYLRRNIYGEYQEAGCIFADYRLDVEESRNLILYGHNMNDGSMFGELSKFLDEDFRKSHPTFSYLTPNAAYECEIFAVYRALVDFPYVQWDFESEEAFLSYMDMVREKSYFSLDVDVKEGERILTLSTCDYYLDPDDGRLVIQAVMRPAEETE